ncbi:M48 family metalloprotease [Streptacidiphilus sp. NEAU-YB345]|uniref:M48 family metalloprotease n=1 Tax=Streptacidiphilus fuscans TaxID=2789292 RepID=A0A931FFS2_9ACTN|nr:M48 family metalloprotease [Streptacidiphilus fuscans]
MHLFFYLPLVLPALAGLVARPFAERLEPRAATWLLTGVAVVLAGASTVALGVLVVAGLIRVPLVAVLGHWSLSAVQRGDPVSLLEAAGASVLLTAATVAAVRLVWRRVRALLAAGSEAACLPRAGEYVVVDDPAPDAYALPGMPGRVVVSSGMLAALDEGEREVLIAHERAHLRAHHYVFVAVTHLAAAANPLLRSLNGAVAYTVERWADEHAARVCGDRRRAARAVGKAALAAKHAPARNPATALGIAGLLRRGAHRRPAGSRSGLRQGDGLRGAGPVPRRVAALLAPPVPTVMPWGVPWLPLLALCALLASSGVCAVAAAHDIHLLLDPNG